MKGRTKLLLFRLKNKYDTTEIANSFDMKLFPRHLCHWNKKL